MVTNPITSYIATAIVVIIAIAGAIVVIVNPETLTFDQYVKDIGIAAGLLAIGRGLDSGSGSRP